MEEEDNDNKEIDNYKVVLIGESGVGKTCILAKFINNSFDPETITSSRSQYTQKNVELQDGKKIIFHFWDTAGQEKYRSLTKIFYKDAHVVVLVYDITNLKSFKEMKDYWYDQVVNYGKENVIFAIAANKNDLEDKREVDDNKGLDFAKTIGAIFVSTSAKEENDNGITILFDEIGQKILKEQNFNYFSNEKKEKLKDGKNNVGKDADENNDNVEKSKSKNFLMNTKTYRESEQRAKRHCCLHN